ncbi:MAG: hypothetical protein KDD41_08125 [Flavobacteriales bacterium]|nr:hypothetical protein [Flavobacteriales bacterium]
MNKLTYILPFFFLVLSLRSHSQTADSLQIVNNKFDSILKTDALSSSRLFYKHQQDMLLNNLGPFGSRYYYPSAWFLWEQDMVHDVDLTELEFKGLAGVKPFTNITYVNASRKEQLFKIQHLQHFGKQLFFTINLNKVSAPGAYINQEANNTFFKSNLDFHTKKKNYHALISAEIQRDFYEENGGLANPEDYEANRFDDARNYSVNLLSSNSFVKRYRYELAQELDIVGFGPDSVTKSNKVYLGHKFAYQTRSRVFYDNDPTSSIYRMNYLDSSKIMDLLALDSLVTVEDSTRFNYLSFVESQPSIDSMFSGTLSNTATLGFKSRENRLEFLFVNEQQQYVQGMQLDTIWRGIDTTYSNNFVGSNLEFKKKHMQVQALFQIGITGYRQGDIKGELHAASHWKSMFLKLKGGYYLTEPDLNFVRYQSNHFEWNNPDLKKQAVTALSVDAVQTKWQLEFHGDVKMVGQALYFDSLSQAAQHHQALTLTTLTLAKNYELWKFHFRTAGSFQITSDEILAPLPQLIGRQVIYFEGRIFKKALKIQLGAGATFTSDYYGYAYSPALSEFYVQGNQRLGNYPSIDLFLNTHLKRAQIFLKWEHFNSGNSNYKSYLVPGYPNLSRSMKFGISWNLFD